MNKKSFIALALLIISGIFFCTNQALAASESPFVLDCLTDSSKFKQCDNVEVFIVLAISIGRYLFSFVGAVALLFFVYGGITMIISHGNKETISKGTKAMTAAVIGLIVAFSGYAIVSFLARKIGLGSSFQLTTEENIQNKIV